MNGGLDLTVSVPAEEWAYAQRRLTYLETLLMRVVRDSQNIQEWFTAGELAGKLLPGLPTTPEAVSRKAGKERWMKRRAKVRGTWFNAYHVSSLPARSFDALISRILDLPEIDAIVPILPDLPEIARRSPVEQQNTAPAWVLPLMRIMKAETGGNLRAAWEILPDRLPPGINLPSVQDAAEVLVRFGLVGGS